MRKGEDREGRPVALQWRSAGGSKILAQPCGGSNIGSNQKFQVAPFLPCPGRHFTLIKSIHMSLSASWRLISVNNGLQPSFNTYPQLSVGLQQLI